MQKITAEQIEQWEEITRENDGDDEYAKAQFNLGIYYDGLSNFHKAFEHWLNIKQEDSARTYASAQYYLAFIHIKLNKIEKAREHLLRIQCEDDREIYAQAQFNLGLSFLNKKDFAQAIEHFSSVDLNYIQLEYSQICLLKAINLIHSFEYWQDVAYILAKVEVILGLLFVMPDTAESKVVHYTMAKTAHKMLTEQSPLRLTTIQNVNDPTEGQILLDYLNINCILPNHIVSNYHAFITCFSFNHDSLNQFRLYGKENNQEASGVSLVLEHSFFAKNHMIDSQIGDVGFVTYVKNDSLKMIAEEVIDRKKIEPLGLYRCIYFHPQTGLLKLARREEWTFYCENHNQQDTAQSTDETAEKWKNYLGDIEEKEAMVKILLDRLHESIKTMLDGQKDKREELLGLLEMILLPLRYLVKHMAFREEQECRIFHVTNLNDKAVKDDFDKKWLYIDYQTINEHLDKMYLAPEALAHQNFFIRALGDSAKDEQGRSRVRLSQNPFRNPIRT